MQVAGVILSGCKEDEKERVQENKKMIEELSDVPVFGLFPKIREEYTRDELIKATEESIQISYLEEYMKNGTSMEFTLLR